jgi:hypothetical protein
VGEPVILDAQPDNPEDENAIGVLRLDGKQIGYIDRGMAASLIDDLTDFTAFVAGIGRGGGPGYLGVSLLVAVNDGQDETVVSAYARQVLEAEGNLGRSARQMVRLRRRQLRRALRAAPSGASALRWAFLALAGRTGSCNVVVGEAAVSLLTELDVSRSITPFGLP